MKFGKRFISLALALVMIFSLTTGASAATAQNIKVQLSPNITVKLDGKVQTMADVNGNPVYPVLNDGTTYVPIRAVSNMLGIGVDWDGATQTVLLDTSKKVTPTKTDAKAPTNAKPTEITVQLSPNITVKLDGKAQSMTDVNGNSVYPLLYEGTTYLPIRAVSNMLGIDVDWDQSTQTVLLSNKIIKIVVENPTMESVRKALEDAGVDQAQIDFTMATMDPQSLSQTACLKLELGDSDTLREKSAKQFIAEFKTSEDAEVLGEKYIGCEFAEIDWSMANDGYIRVKLNKQMTKTNVSRCNVISYDERYNQNSSSYVLPLNKWVNIPLLNGAREYMVAVEPIYSEDDINNDMTEEELDAAWRDPLKAKFMANIDNPDVVWLLSTIDIDFDNAPKTCAKAMEITKNCKTDAEKITAIFEWVANNIKYNYKLYEEIIAWGILIRTGSSEINPQYDLFKNGTREHLVLDDILTSKSGVCEDYAVLMAGMLRAIGVPCKVVIGEVYDGKIIKGYNDNTPGWVSHAWVAVNPKTGTLDKKALGAGKDFAPPVIGETVNSNPTGWIRLDPTWGKTAEGRDAASVDKNHMPTYCY